MAASNLNQKEYLRKYLSGPKKEGNKKKKGSKKERNSSKSNSKIIDDDVDLRKIDEMGRVFEEEEEYGEEAPQIAAIIDERPAHLQGKWKTLGDDVTANNEKQALDDGDFLQRLAGGRAPDKDLSPPRKRHDSDSDMSPPRNRRDHEVTTSQRKATTRRKRHDSNDSISPPRNTKKFDSNSDISRSTNRAARSSFDDIPQPRNRKRHDSNSDVSPQRNRRNFDSNVPPSRDRTVRNSEDFLPPSGRRNHDSNGNVLTRDHNLKRDVLPRRNRKRHSSNSDTSPPRTKKQHDLGSIISPHRNRKRHDSNSDISPPRNSKSINSPNSQRYKSRDDREVSCRSRKRHDSNSDFSPPRKGVSSSYAQRLKNVLPPGSRSRHDSNSDISPPRSRKINDYDDERLLKNRKEPSISPPAQKRSNRGKKVAEHARRRHDSDRDVSPPENRRQRAVLSSRHSHSLESKSKEHIKDSPSSLSPSRRRKGHDMDNKASRTPRDTEGQAKNLEGTRPSETQSGMKAGLQHAGLLREELRSAKEREQDVLNTMGMQAGRDADTIFRDRETGKKRDLKEERRQKRLEAAKLAEQQEKYMEWGRGVKQTADKQNQLEQDMYEMSKPLARYKDDPDLERHLKEQERDGDPMLEFIKKRKAKDNPQQSARPIYKGPPAPPNRFAILPGYRWDGVDRSNGFEKKIFERSNSKVALEEEAYKWSISDM